MTPNVALGEKCPNCGGTLIPIVYGFPGPGLMDEADAGHVRLGGCVVMGNDPAWECSDCERWFNVDLAEAPREQRLAVSTPALWGRG